MRILFTQAAKYLLTGVFQKISLDILAFVFAKRLPDQVDMIAHDAKGVHVNAFLFHQKSNAVHYYFFDCFSLEKVLPFQASGGKEVGIFDSGCHHRKYTRSKLVMLRNLSAGERV
jgi:hypothetical protein